jgi:hypothetical protein
MRDYLHENEQSPFKMIKEGEAEGREEILFIIYLLLLLLLVVAAAATLTPLCVCVKSATTTTMMKKVGGGEFFVWQPHNNETNVHDIMDFHMVAAERSLCARSRVIHLIVISRISFGGRSNQFCAILRSTTTLPVADSNPSACVTRITRTRSAMIRCVEKTFLDTRVGSMMMMMAVVTLKSIRSNDEQLQIALNASGLTATD